MMPWSSDGANSVGDMRNIGMQSNAMTTQTKYAAGRADNTPSRARVYMSRSRVKARLTMRAKPRSSMPGLKSLAHMTGDTVRATMPETRTAPAKVKANSRKSAPVSPPWNPMGA